MARTAAPTAQPAARKPGKTPRGVPTPPVALPHERDESADQTQHEVDPVMHRAYKDLQEGQVDTDMRATPGLDADRRRRLVPRSRGG